MSRKRRRGPEGAAPEAPRAARPARLAGGLLAVVAAATWLTFAGVTRHELLNWDDAELLSRNARLTEPGVAGWAFTTGFKGHYQPLSWLAWSLLARTAGLDPRVCHAASLALHVLNTGLVFMLATALASAAGFGSGARALSAAAAALVFGLHPLRVEPVAWASALPYLLALAPLLASLGSYLRYAANGSLVSLLAAFGLYAVSVLARPAAPGFALVLLATDAWLGRLKPWRRTLYEKLPFAVLGLAGVVAEASARRFAAIEGVDSASRAAAAAWAPLLYLARTLWPADLTPLDPQPLASSGSLAGAMLPATLALAATVAFVTLGRRVPALPTAWAAYLVLIAPAALLGLAPSGLQATADRYTYVPGVALALLAGGALGRLAEAPGRRAAAFVLLTTAALAMSLATLRYLPHWRDSVSLWNRALAVEPGNDVALYNLAHALEERGDETAALARYDELLRLVPDHAPARQNRDRLEARRLEEQAGALAQARRLAEAVDLYSGALALDPRRLHSRRSRGMALAELGRFEEAIPDLRAALQADAAEPSVRHALAYALRQSGHGAEAEAVLAAAPRK